VQDSIGARLTNGQTVPAFSPRRTSRPGDDSIRRSFNPGERGSLAVTASSSDQNILPTLTASLGGVMTNARRHGRA
jgi:hypothetical protein